MSKKDRLTEVFERLRYEKILSTKKDFAEKIGFDKTNLSSAFGGAEKYLTDSLFNKIADSFPQFNRNWLLTGEGEMLKNPPSVNQVVSNIGDNITIPREAWEVIKSQADSLKCRDNQVDELIGMLKGQLLQQKEGRVHQGDNVISAAAE